MAERARWWALSVWVVTAGLAIANAVLTAMAWDDLEPSDQYTNLFGSLASVLYVSLGVVVVLRAANRIGWLLLAVGLTFVLVCTTSSYAVVGVLTHPGSLPAARPVGTASEWIFVPLFVLMAYMLIVFPTGTLPSPRWRPARAVGAAALVVVTIAFVVAPRDVGLPAPGGVSLVYPNPLATDWLGAIDRGLGSINALAAFYLVLLAAAVVALVHRFREGSGEVRQQILWVALAAGTGLALQVVASGAQLSCGCALPPVAVVAQLAQGVVALVGVPLAITVAILKYGLYRIERIVNRALVYGVLSVTLGAVYLGTVLLLQLLLHPVTTQSDVAVAASTLAAAALFRPARRRIQGAVDRRFYRNRYDAGRTLDVFASQLRHEVDLDNVARDLRTAVHETYQPTHVSLWLRS